MEAHEQIITYFQGLTAHPPLSIPPIHESLLDISIIPADNSAQPDYSLLASRFAQQFPIDKPIKTIQFTLDAGGVSNNSEEKLVGHQYWSSDEKQLHYARADGFSFNKLAPYTDGDDMAEKLLHGFKIYQEASPGCTISRLVATNINFIEIKRPNVDLEEYFTIAPDVPQDLQKYTVSSFTSRVTQQFSPTVQSHVTLQTIPTGPNCKFRLDIEVECRIENNEITPSDLQLLRLIKNKLFFSSLKEKTLRMFT